MFVDLSVNCICTTAELSGCWAVPCQGGKACCLPHCRSLCWGSEGAPSMSVCLLALAGAERGQRPAELCPLHGCRHRIWRGGSLRNLGKKRESPSLAPVSRALHWPGVTHAMCCHTGVPPAWRMVSWPCAVGLWGLHLLLCPDAVSRGSAAEPSWP